MSEATSRRQARSSHGAKQSKAKVFGPRCQPKIGLRSEAYPFDIFRGHPDFGVLTLWILGCFAPASIWRGAKHQLASVVGGVTRALWILAFSPKKSTVVCSD